MEDVEIEKMNESICFSFSPTIYKSMTGSFFSGNIFAEEGFVFWSNEIQKSKIENIYSEKDLKILIKLNGFFEILGGKQEKSKLINETIFNETAISYDKGCFLGSETVSKIQNGRGGSYAPIMLINENIDNDNLPKKEDIIYIDKLKMGKIEDIVLFDNQQIFLVSLFRKYRVENLDINITVNDHSFSCRVENYPFFKDTSWKEKGITLYDKGMNDFIENKEDAALESLELARIYDATNSDVCETLGVIYGRHNQFDKAIALMDELLKIDDTSVMAHTNKSLYLMKLGRIEEAEEEKSKATLKTFASLGTQAELKEQEEKEKIKQAENVTRRKSMFLQILDLDSKDLTANLGLADIEFNQASFNQSLKYLSKIEEDNDKNADYYYLLAQNYEMLNDVDKSKKILSNGNR